MKNIVLYFFLIITSIKVISAQGFTGLSFGVSGGYSNNQNYNLETFTHFNFKWDKVIFDVTAGGNYQPYMIKYAERNDLKVNKFGFFGEITTFPFLKTLFTGLRFECAGNWFTKNTINTLDKHTLYAPNWYFSLGFLGVTGIDIPVFARIKFRAYSIYGIHVYEVSKFEFISSDFLYRQISGKTRIDFSISANAGFIILINDRTKRKNEKVVL